MSSQIAPIAIPPDLPPAPPGWRWHKLTDVARLESGHTPSRSRPDWWGGDVSWISLTEIRALDGKWVENTQIRTNEYGIANSAARILPRGTVCFSRTASVGFVTIMAAPMATSQDFANWVCSDELDPEFLMYALICSRRKLRELATGATHKTIYMPMLEAFHVCVPSIEEQRRIAARLKSQLAEVEATRLAAQAQAQGVARLADTIVLNSVREHPVVEHSLGDVLVEMKRGIGVDWSDHPVLGATRDGVAPAKEAPGKHAAKYKPVLPGTVFYNPMRILIGSIAFVDDDDTPGITSPDYVVLQGKPERVDSRWFYYWLRSPLGAACINSLARGAVRERMLFNRLAEGKIELPEFSVQQRASAALKELKAVRTAINKQLREIDLLPQKILTHAFEK
ncbi:restriction endonuclease subunit S [Telluria mixta]|uniref:Restriction endonuclease subunit S n=1 Tax=Telluria mixta TaxID=34071 RepID=A0ABT2C2U8_9BURK|nr:restriction endonuclease subunit S [Telluria mixta]MCS0631656.1 restriction endonuclease subunit S [Telluria mixta]WEM98406.1 restriction endonuclease subunit S [Telluria mixta]